MPNCFWSELWLPAPLMLRSSTKLEHFFTLVQLGENLRGEMVSPMPAKDMDYFVCNLARKRVGAKALRTVFETVSTKLSRTSRSSFRKNTSSNSFPRHAGL